MIRLLFISFSSLFFIPTGNPEPERFKPINQEFPLLWKAKIGNASFRTNLVVTEKDLFIGSNGKYFMDYRPNDPTSGMYKIDRTNGQVIRQFGNDEIIGDMDVNGVLLYQNKIYFGNDNDDFICTNTDGKLLWSIPTAGDIEHQPVLIQIDQRPAVVYATENGEVRAVNPDNGKTIWAYYTPDFNGWRYGDSRTFFKVRSFFHNTSAFFTKPLVTDLNSDGVNDLTYLTYSNQIYAINGKSGKILWHIEPNENIYNIEILPKPDGDRVFVAGSINYRSASVTHNIQLISRSGNMKSILELPYESYSQSLNFFFNGPDELLINDCKYLYRLKKLKHLDSINRSNKYEKVYDWTSEVFHNRNSYAPLFGNKVFPYKKYKECVFTLYQYDPVDNEKGFMEIISLDQKKVVARLELPGISELPPQIGDVNKDGKLDLLINSGSKGELYCYDLKTPVSSN